MVTVHNPDSNQSSLALSSPQIITSQEEKTSEEDTYSSLRPVVGLPPDNSKVGEHDVKGVEPKQDHAIDGPRRNCTDDNNEKYMKHCWFDTRTGTWKPIPKVKA
eukprot:gnl/MRDRNA2_/MRDRNA2_171460_c0_seq1.p1 gnl/MRDRNA2_/MRDRNA2_171460_c0~~gnl/MRDRNA2_/MRDRNA2_171460_c0_seq1.p1  ORF type:complete len:104 (-),score=16.97 gnl/MRDRNA2_/MRDRNA2_171460_c0_seq1:213-524(-)